MDPLAYVVEPTTDRGHFFENVPKGVLCENCRSCIDYSYIPERLDVNLGNLDLVSTFDNRLIASGRFREVVVSEGEAKANFVAINSREDIYLVEPQRCLQIDIERAQTEFISECRVCGKFESVIERAPIVLLDIELPIDGGFYRSDLEFGSGAEKSALLIVGIETKECLVSSALKGLFFLEVSS